MGSRLHGNDEALRTWAAPFSRTLIQDLKNLHWIPAYAGKTWVELPSSRTPIRDPEKGFTTFNWAPFFNGVTRLVSTGLHKKRRSCAGRSILETKERTMDTIAIYLILFLLSLICMALFAYLETSFTALRLFEVNQLEARVGRYTSFFATWRSAPQRLLITILIASSFADVVSSVLITEIMQKTFGGELGLALGVFCATIIILFFGNILPKTFAKHGAKNLSPTAIGFVSLLLKLFRPFVSLSIAVTNFFSYRLNGSSESAGREVTEKEIEFLIDYSDQKGLIEADKSEMLQNVFGLGQTTVASIMVPKEDMVMLDVNTSMHKAQELFSSYRYSRIPLYENKEDNIVGFIYQKDLFALMHKQQTSKLREFMRPVVFIPESKKVNQLMREFLKTRRHLAIVIDEYGSVEGLATLEDVLEELVGEIRDEHEEVASLIVPLENGEYLIDGKAELKKVAEELNISLPSQIAVTIGGFLSEHLQHVPKKGERVVWEGYCFQVQQASLRKVAQVLVFKDSSTH